MKRSIWLVSALVFVIGTSVFCTYLDGQFVFDDSASIVHNKDIKPELSSWTDMLYNDFWGETLVSATSHKSFRPVTTATYRINYILGALNPWGYHLLSAIIHGITSSISTVLAFELFDAITPACFAGLLFAVHPIHSEAVSNISGRADVLCAFWYLFGLYAYTRYVKVSYQYSESIQKQQEEQIQFDGSNDKATNNEVRTDEKAEANSGLRRRKFDSFTGVDANKHDIDVKNAPTSEVEKKSNRDIYIKDDACPRFPMALLLISVSTSLAMFSKEHGITLPMAAVIIDFHFTKLNYPLVFGCILSLIGCKQEYQQKYTDAQRRNLSQWLMRTILLAAMTITVVSWRLWLNGGNAPHLSREQNAAWQENIVHRYLCIFYTWLMYLYILTWPYVLSPEYTNLKMPTMSIYDPRTAATSIFFLLLVTSFLYAVFGSRASSPSPSNRKYQVSFALLLFPFVLSSNLFIMVGFTMAERVIYLPSYGYCLIVAQLIYEVLMGKSFTDTGNTLNENTTRQNKKEKKKKICADIRDGFIWMSFLAAIGLLSVRCIHQHRTWDNAPKLWESAFQVNPTSNLINYNYGIELSRVERHRESVDRFIEACVPTPLNFPCYTSLLTELRAIDDCTSAKKITNSTLVRMDQLRHLLDSRWDWYLIDNGYEVEARKVTRRLTRQEVVSLTEYFQSMRQRGVSMSWYFTQDQKLTHLEKVHMRKQQVNSTMKNYSDMYAAVALCGDTYDHSALWLHRALMFWPTNQHTFERASQLLELVNGQVGEIEKLSEGDTKTFQTLIEQYRSANSNVWSLLHYMEVLLAIQRGDNTEYQSLEEYAHEQLTLSLLTARQEELTGGTKSGDIPPWPPTTYGDTPGVESGAYSGKESHWPHGAFVGYTSSVEQIFQIKEKKKKKKRKKK